MSASNQWVRARRFCRGLFFFGKWLHENAAFPQIDKAEVFPHHVDATTGKPRSLNKERGGVMTENEEKPPLGGASSESSPSALEARVQELEKQIADLQQQVAALTKMVERIVKPANKVVNGIMSGISAVKEHLKGSENP